MLISRISSYSKRSSTAVSIGPSKNSTASAKLMPCLPMFSWSLVQSRSNCRVIPFLNAIKCKSYQGSGVKLSEHRGLPSAPPSKSPTCGLVLLSLAFKNEFLSENGTSPSVDARKVTSRTGAISRSGRLHPKLARHGHDSAGPALPHAPIDRICARRRSRRIGLRLRNLRHFNRGFVQARPKPA